MTKRNYTISRLAQMKMAMHATRHGLSNPIHGIVLGKVIDGDSTVQVVDVVPVCHEVPTKPIVDMALRLTDAHLSSSSSSSTDDDSSNLEGVQIIGWYTANANASILPIDESKDELPNAPACRIASSMAECDADGSDDVVLLLLSTSQLVKCINGGGDCLPVCHVYQRDKSRAFTQRVAKDGVTSTGNLKSDPLSKAIEEQLGANGMRKGGGNVATGKVICDYVDHLENHGDGDWIENRMVDLR